VIDEAHQILSHASFRSQFTKIKQLAPFQVQKIYVTGSLPIRLERRFLLETSLSYATRIIRASTFQLQISFNLFRVSNMNTTLGRLAIDIAKFMETVMDPDQIGIIFCTNKRDTDELHKRFTHCSSHSDLLPSNRAHNEAEWLAGHKRWIAATTGLIHGIDAPNVGAVIFLGLPYGLINTYQGAGRSGRDGRRSWAIIIDSINTQLLQPHRKDDDLECVTEGLALLEREDCRHLPFSETLDGTRTACLDNPLAHLCDVCDPDSQIVAGITPLLLDPVMPFPLSIQPLVAMDEEPDEYDKYNDSMEVDVDFVNLLPFPLIDSDRNESSTSQAPTTRTHHQQMAIAPSHLIPPSTNAPSAQILSDVSCYHEKMRTLQQKSNMLNRVTSKLSTKCVLCWAYRGVYDKQHGGERLWVKCRDQSGYSRHIDWIGFKKLFQFPRYQYCFQCFLPQGIYLPPAHPDFHKNNPVRKACPLEDFVVLLVLMIRYDSSWWMKARIAFQSLPAQPNEREYAKWCQVVEHGENFYNGLELILWFFMEYKPTQSE
jgi:hypothetical protein